MKKTTTILAIGSALIGSASAEIESSFHVGYSTDYVFRGVNQAPGTNSGLYEYGLDFTGDCNCGATWNAGIWRADFADAQEETDLFASISKEYGAYDVSLGLVRYDYGNGGQGDTTELALGAATELAGFDVAATVYYDIDANDGVIYGEISVGKSYDVGNGVSLDIAANYGLLLDDQGLAGSYATYGVSAALSKELGENLTGSINVAAEKGEGNLGKADGDDFWGGISLSYGF